jgi:hypothetical protein
VAAVATAHAAQPPRLAVARFVSDSAVELVQGASRKVVRRGERFGAWTLVEVVAQGQGPEVGLAVLEDFSRKDGRILFVDASGVRVDLPKTLEPTEADTAGLYLGRSREEILASSADLLGSQVLARTGDPEYAEIARAFPPIHKIAGNTYNFVGSPHTFEKVGFAYGGRTAHFDPAVYQPSIDAIRTAGKVWDGLVGGYLPVLRFVYPEDNGDWTEFLAFAPFRMVNDNDRVQPVWYRVSRVEKGTLMWSRHFDSYHPFPPRRDGESRAFYSDLAKLKRDWDDVLRQAMKVELPDERVADMARFGLVRAIMTRVGDYPKYGAVDKNYGGSEHDGFPDTFNVETAAMVEWGLLDRAGRYIDNYFGEFVRDDGSILYRGPETGQYGRMLTVLAQYVEAGGDPAVLVKHRGRIDAVARLLLSMRARALELPASDAAYGMIAGWSEADSSLEKDPARYVQPYFSNSTEAARGFRDLGRVWEAVGRDTGNAELTAWGRRLVREAEALRKDVALAISRSLLEVDGRTVLPAVAGAKEHPHAAARRDPTDPQFRAYRAYMEMMYSGNLTAEQVRTIVDYRSSHHDTLLGVPTAYGYYSNEMAGFLSYGHGYGLIQFDWVREALLMMYSHMAHQYTRGGWMAPETTRPLSSEDAAPYCTPAQLVATLMTRWLLVFEDPESDTLWLGKAIPRQWLRDGRRIVVTDAPTRWGRVGFSIVSHAGTGAIKAQVRFPDAGLRAETRLRLRAYDNARMRSATLNGKPWTRFDPESEVVVLPAGTRGAVELEVRY